MNNCNATKELLDIDIEYVNNNHLSAKSIAFGSSAVEETSQVFQFCNWFISNKITRSLIMVNVY